MKTRQQWFEDELPADIAAMAIRNTEDQSGFLDLQCISLRRAITRGFMWSDTPQGYFFWHQVSQGNCGQIEYSKENKQ